MKKRWYNIIFIMAVAFFIAFTQQASASADLYKLCPKCNVKIPKIDSASKLDLNFCPSCGTDLKTITFKLKTGSEKVLELIRQKRQQIGETRQLRASEWFDKGETSEDKIMKMACFINAIELDNSNPKAYNNLGVLYDEKTMTTEAISCFRRALELKPDYALALNNLAKCVSDAGHYEDAFANYKKAIELEPGNGIFHRNFADTLSKMNKYEESIAEYKKAIELDKNTLTANIATFKIDLITKRLKLKDPSSASAADETKKSEVKNSGTNK